MQLNARFAATRTAGAPVPEGSQLTLPHTKLSGKACSLLKHNVAAGDMTSMTACFLRIYFVKGLDKKALIIEVSICIVFFSSYLLPFYLMMNSCSGHAHVACSEWEF